jgi:hypothetical protein
MLLPLIVACALLTFPSRAQNVSAAASSAPCTPGALPVYTSSILVGSPAGAAGSANGVGTAATLTNPAYMAIASGPLAGVLLVGEQTGCRIRAINLTSANVTTFAGRTVCGTDVNGPLPSVLMNIGGIAWALRAQVVYFSSLTGYRLRVAVPGGNVTTVAGSGATGQLDGIGTNAQFNGPRGLALDEIGQAIYVIDYVRHVVRTVNITTRAVTTLAGTGAQGYANGVAASAIFFQPTGGVLSADRRSLYVTDSGSNRIRLISLTAPGVAANVSMVLQGTPRSPRDLLLDTSGGQQSLLVVNFNNGASGTLQRLDVSASGSGVADVVAGAGGSPASTANALALRTNFSGFMGGAISSDGTRVFVSEYGGHRVRVLSLACPVATPSTTPAATATPTVSASQPATPTSSGSSGASSSTTPSPTATSASATATATETTSSTPSLTALPSQEASVEPTPASPMAPASASLAATPSSTASQMAPSSVGGNGGTAAASPAMPLTASPAMSLTATLSTGASPSATATASLSTGASPSASTSAAATAVTTAQVNGGAAAAAAGGGAAAAAGGGAAAALACLAAAVAAAVLVRRRRATRGAAVQAAPSKAGAVAKASGGGSANPMIAAAAPVASFRATAPPPPPPPPPLAAAPSGRAAAQAPAAPRRVDTPGGGAGGRGGGGEWVEKMSRSKALPYWTHSITGETTWTRPSSSSSSSSSFGPLPSSSGLSDSASSSVLPPGWTEHLSKSKGTLYWRSTSGETSWVRPK